jgi:hypothetical protein
MIEAWRVWRPFPTTAAVEVMGTYWEYPWHPGTNVAMCPSGCAEVPGEGCHCGFWGLADPRDLGALNVSAVALVGTVGLSGRIREHERGLRAERARPLAVSLVVARGRVLTGWVEGGYWVLDDDDPDRWTNRWRTRYRPCTYDDAVARLRAQGWPVVDPAEFDLPVELARCRCARLTHFTFLPPGRTCAGVPA